MADRKTIILIVCIIFMFFIWQSGILTGLFTFFQPIPTGLIQWTDVEHYQDRVARWLENTPVADRPLVSRTIIFNTNQGELKFEQTVDTAFLAYTETPCPDPGASNCFAWCYKRLNVYFNGNKIDSLYNWKDPETHWTPYGESSKLEQSYTFDGILIDELINQFGVKVTLGGYMESGAYPFTECTFSKNIYTISYPDDSFNITIETPEEGYIQGEDVEVNVKVINNLDIKAKGNLEIRFAVPTIFGETTDTKTEEVVLNPGENIFSYIIPTGEPVRVLKVTPILSLELETGWISGLNANNEWYNEYPNCLPCYRGDTTGSGVYIPLGTFEGDITEIQIISEAESLREQLDLLQNDIVALQALLNEKAQLLNQLELTLQEQIEIIENYELLIDEKAYLISQLELNLNEQTQLILELTGISEEQAILIDALEISIIEQAQIINEMQLTVQQQSDIIEELDLTIQEQAQMINQLELNLQQKAILINQLTATNEEQAELIAQMALSFAEQADIIEALQALIGNDAEIILTLYDTIHEQAQLISELEYTNEQLAQLIIDMDLNLQEQAELILELELTIEAKGQIIASLELSLAEEAEIINQLELTISEQAELILELDLSLADERELVESLYDTIEEQQALIDELEQQREEPEEEAWYITYWWVLLIGGVFFLLIIMGGRRR